MDFETLIIKIAKILNKLRIPYFITGGYAVAVWGRLRATFDIDVVIEMFHPQVDKFAKEMRGLGKAVYIDEDMMSEALARRGEFNVIHPESGIKMDFFVAGVNPQGKQELARARAYTIKEQKVFFISPEDLILSKLRWYQQGGGERHLEDAQSVIKKSGKLLDDKYLKKQISAQSLDELWMKIRKD